MPSDGTRVSSPRCHMGTARMPRVSTPTVLTLGRVVSAQTVLQGLRIEVMLRHAVAVAMPTLCLLRAS
eukprot:11599359-Karenia_brevis.AAC.1